MNSIPIVFGEALFDTFPDGQRVLGGAPFNVAWHLGGFGLKPLFVSRVGDDGPGRELLARMSAWGLETRAVQRDPHHPTGNVQVRIANDQPSFEIEAEQAYDYIDSAEVREVVGSPSNAVLYHGSLAIRSDISRQALETIATPEQGIVCDLNLRPPWWTRERVRWCLDRAAWIKLNDKELGTITGESASSVDDCVHAARSLSNRQEHAHVIVTRGSSGAIAVFGDGEVVQVNAPEPTGSLVDTVGAGDAFSAVLILGLIRGWDRTVTLERAAAFAARICAQQGATATDPPLYTSVLAAFGETA